MYQHEPLAATVLDALGTHQAATAGGPVAGADVDVFSAHHPSSGLGVPVADHSTPGPAETTRFAGTRQCPVGADGHSQLMAGRVLARRRRPGSRRPYG